MSEILFRITGPEAPSFADEFGAMLEREFGRPRLVPHDPVAPTGTKSDVGEAIAIVLALPAAALAALDLVKRLQYAEKLKRLTELVRSRSGVRVTVVRHEVELQLHVAKPGEVLELVAPAKSPSEEVDAEKRDK